MEETLASAINLDRYVRKLEQDDLHQEWSVSDLVWLINALHGALQDTLQALNDKEGK